MADRSKTNGQAGRPANASRRRLLARLGALAAYTAPVMTTLLLAEPAQATHQPGHLDACVGPNPPPQCDINPCAGASPPPFCEVGSMAAGPEAGFDASVDQAYAPADEAGWDSPY